MHVKHDGSQEIGKVAMNAYHQKKAAEDKRQRKILGVCGWLNEELLDE